MGLVVTADGDGNGRRFKPVDITVGQRDIERLDGRFKMFDTRCPDDGSIDPVFMKKPRQRNLSHRRTLLAGQLLDTLVDSFVVTIEIREYSRLLVCLTSGGGSESLVGSSETSSGQRAPRNDSDSFLLTVW